MSCLWYGKAEAEWLLAPILCYTSHLSFVATTVCMCVRAYICMHTHTHTHKYTYIYMDGLQGNILDWNIYACADVAVCKYLHTHTQ